jgi:hypothetical protein
VAELRFANGLGRQGLVCSPASDHLRTVAVLA